MEYQNCGKPTKIHNITLYNCDCIELLKETPDKYYELAIVDPPYGIGADNVKERIIKKTETHGEIRGKAYTGNWDNSIPTKKYFNELFRVSKNQIIWGGNYFIEHLYNTRCCIMWDKKSIGFTGADFELAWSSFETSCRAFRMSRVMAYSNPNKMERENRIHPTQKPVALYKWLLKNYAKEGDKILDTHLGSGSIAIACHYMGFELTGCELDKEYFDASVQRITDKTRQQTLNI